MGNVFESLHDLERTGKCRIYCQRFIYEGEMSRVKDNVITMRDVTVLGIGNIGKDRVLIPACYKHKEITILMSSIESFCRISK